MKEERKAGSSAEDGSDPERAAVLLRRRLFLSAALATTAACGGRDGSGPGPNVCLEPPHVCLQPYIPPCELSVRFIVFHGMSTTLDAAGQAAVRTAAQEATHNHAMVMLQSFALWPPGAAWPPATQLVEPRRRAVHEGLIASGLPPQSLIPDEGSAPTAVDPQQKQLAAPPGGFAPGSGLVEISCHH